MPRLLTQIALGFAALALCLTPQQVPAQGAPAHRSYISPFPNGDRYRVAVLGDSLGEGLWSGLFRTFEADPTVDVIQSAKRKTGFSRSGDLAAGLDKIINEGQYQVAVIMFGASDMGSIKKDGKWLKIGSEAWREAYGARVEAYIKKLRAANIAVYWVGLPAMRNATHKVAADKLNDVYREKTFVNGAKFIESKPGFVDKAGAYNAFGPDKDGKNTQLRLNDGIHFTSRGNLKLADLVEKELGKDLTTAKKERDIPLAGDEDEQAKVTTLAAAAAVPRPVAAAGEAGGALPDGKKKEKLQESQVGDVSVVSPTFVGATIPLTDPAGAAGPPEPESILSEVPGGLTAVATLSAVTDSSVASSRPQLPLRQRPYYRVLIRGEQLDPKSGRADDFAWPPS